MKQLLSLPKKLFRASFSHNFALKMLSLALAVLFWVFVMDQVNPEMPRTFYSVPVSLINYKEIAQNNLQIMNEHDYFANVVVTGRRNHVLSLTTDSIKLTADMRNVRSGMNQIPIQATLGNDQATVKLVTPGEISLNVDRIVSIPKTVRIVFTDHFESGLSASGVIASPAEIRVSGPESIVNTVASLRGYVSASSIRSDTSREVILEPIDYDDKPVAGVKLEQGYSNATISLNRSRTVPVRAVFEEELEPGFAVTSKKIRVEQVNIIGPKSVVDAINAVNMEKVTIRGKESYSGVSTLVLPDGVSADETSIRYDIEIEKIETAEYIVPLTKDLFVGLPAGLEAQFVEENPSCAFRVRAIAGRLSEITTDMLRVTVDLTNAVEGDYSAPLVVAVIRDASGKEMETELLSPTVPVRIRQRTTSE